MISALGWIRRESAAVKPTKYQLSESDYNAFLEQANEQISKTRQEAQEAGIDLETALKEKVCNDGSDIEMSTTTAAAIEEEEDPELAAKYNLDDYDNENVNGEQSDDDEDLDASEDEEMMLDADDDGNGIFMPLSKLIKPDKHGISGDQEEFDEEELEDLTLRPSDLLFVAAKTEDEISQLEIYVYEEEVVGESGGLEDNLYVHHDLMLPSFPLCLEWIDFASTGQNKEEKGNFVAVGSFEKQIEIWNLDVLDLVYPTVSLKGHEDAVMSLSWNRQGRNFLASGSADNTVRLWDLNRPEQGPLRTFDHHCGKVQSVNWNPNPANSTELLSVAYDGLVRLFDVRAPQDGINFASKLKGDVEQAKWRPKGNAFAVSDESGRVSFYDPRNPSQPLALLDAHPKSVTCLDFCSVDSATGNSIFLTASADKSLKIWSIDSSSTNFNCLLSREMGVGKIFASGFLPDAPLIVAAAGNRGNVNMWNLKKEDVIKSYFTTPSA